MDGRRGGPPKGASTGNANAKGKSSGVSTANMFQALDGAGDEAAAASGGKQKGKQAKNTGASRSAAPEQSVRADAAKPAANARNGPSRQAAQSNNGAKGTAAPAKGATKGAPEAESVEELLESLPELEYSDEEGTLPSSGAKEGPPGRDDFDDDEIPALVDSEDDEDDMPSLHSSGEESEQEKKPPATKSAASSGNTGRPAAADVDGGILTDSSFDENELEILSDATSDSCPDLTSHDEDDEGWGTEEDEHAARESKAPVKGGRTQAVFGISGNAKADDAGKKAAPPAQQQPAAGKGQQQPATGKGQQQPAAGKGQQQPATGKGQPQGSSAAPASKGKESQPQSQPQPQPQPNAAKKAAEPPKKAPAPPPSQGNDDNIPDLLEDSDEDLPDLVAGEDDDVLPPAPSAAKKQPQPQAASTMGGMRSGFLNKAAAPPPQPQQTQSEQEYARYVESGGSGDQTWLGRFAEAGDLGAIRTRLAIAKKGLYRRDFLDTCYRAVKNGREGVVDELLRRVQTGDIKYIREAAPLVTDVVAHVFDSGERLLTTAIAKKHIDLALMLMSRYGCKPSLEDVRLSLFSNSDGLVGEIVRKMPRLSDVTGRAQSGADAWLLEMLRRNVPDEVFQALLDVAFNDRIPTAGNKSLAQLAVQHGRADLVGRLVHKYGMATFMSVPSGESPLLMACRNAMTDIVKTIVEGGKEQVSKYLDVADGGGNTPLMCAIKSRPASGNFTARDDLVAYLVGLNVSLADRNHDKEWALSLALDAPQNEAILDTLMKRTTVEAELETAVSRSRTDVSAKIVAYAARKGVLHSGEFKASGISIYAFVSESRDGSFVDVVEQLINHGAAVNARRKKSLETPLHVVSDPAMARLLIAKGADITLGDANDNTPLHLACDRGDVDVIRELIDAGASATVQNAKGQTAFVLARNKNVRKALQDAVDARAQRLAKAAASAQAAGAAAAEGTKKRKKKKKAADGETEKYDEATRLHELRKADLKTEEAAPGTAEKDDEDEGDTRTLAERLLVELETSGFKEPPPDPSTSMDADEGVQETAPAAAVATPVPAATAPLSDAAPVAATDAVSAPAPQPTLSSAEFAQPPSEDEADDSADDIIASEPATVISAPTTEVPAGKRTITSVVRELLQTTFEGLPWEIVFTRAAKETILTLESRLRVALIEKLRLLASGFWSKTLAKGLVGVPPTLRLYELKLTKGARVLWERGIDFSERTRMYTDTIRVWSVHMHHDDVPNGIAYVVGCHRLGAHASIRKRLQANKGETALRDADGTELRIPHTYTLLDAGAAPTESSPHFDSLEETPAPMRADGDSEMTYFPPASASQNAYTIMKFYSLSNELFRVLLHTALEQQPLSHVDLAFRADQTESMLINLTPTPPSSILLLGRSGTGKTTVAVQRMWAKYRAGRMIAGVDAAATEQSAAHGDEGKKPEDAPDGTFTRRQLFVTRNKILRDQVRKSFRGQQQVYMQGRGEKFEPTDVIPASFSAEVIGDGHFPMFLTATEWLSMIDATLPEPFFPRNPDGTVAAQEFNIEWHEEIGSLDALPSLDDGLDDMDVAKAEGADGSAQQQQPQLNRSGSRREVDYAYFESHMWPKMVSNNARAAKALSPSTVFTEIFSFIKGSMLAMERERGRLSQDDYLKLPTKMAPSFRPGDAGDGSEDVGRGLIYHLYERYEKIKRDENCYDIADVIWHIYRQIATHGYRGVRIDSITVDEVQDFTQAELRLFLLVANDKNDLFLTGDTCQTIARGVGFRFQDVRTMFHAEAELQQARARALDQQAAKEGAEGAAADATNANGSVAGAARVDWQQLVPVQVPRIHQLTVNYRTHSGILNCANAVVEMLINYFPASVDKLKRERGHFEGPKPLLLSETNSDDLCVLLVGSDKKASQIEFGAHQVIIVRSQEAKNSLPEEFDGALVMTVFEAKGLEFDDVFLYNFFHDSPADKEWRVVTQYEQDTHAQQPEGADEDVAEITDSIDAPRPLKFDEKQHILLGEELKHLYTALTRARVRVAIYDQSVSKRQPMFHFLQARGLVETVSVLRGEQASRGSGLAVGSSAAEWRKRGNNLFESQCFSLAAQCYKKSGDRRLERLALARQLTKRAQYETNERRRREMFFEAGYHFLSVSNGAYAARCFYTAGEYDFASRIYRALGEFKLSAQCRLRSGDRESASAMLVQAGMYEHALQLLRKARLYDKCIELLEQHPEFRPAGNQSVAQFAQLAAAHHHARKDTAAVLRAVERLPLQEQVAFLTRYGYADQLVKMLTKAGHRAEAAEVLANSGQVARAAELLDDAKATKDERRRAANFYAKVATASKDKGEQEVYLRRALNIFSGLGATDEESGVKLLLGRALSDELMLRDAQTAYRAKGNTYGEAVVQLAMLRRFAVLPVKKVDARSAEAAPSGELMLPEAALIIRSIVEALEVARLYYKVAVEFVRRISVAEASLPAVQSDVVMQCERFYDIRRREEDGLLVIDSANIMYSQLLRDHRVEQGLADVPGSRGTLFVVDPMVFWRTIAREAAWRSVEALRMAQLSAKSSIRRAVTCHAASLGIECPSKESCAKSHEPVSRERIEACFRLAELAALATSKGRARVFELAPFFRRSLPEHISGEAVDDVRSLSPANVGAEDPGWLPSWFDDTALQEAVDVLYTLLHPPSPTLACGSLAHELLMRSSEARSGLVELLRARAQAEWSSSRGDRQLADGDLALKASRVLRDAGDSGSFSLLLGRAWLRLRVNLRKRSANGKIGPKDGSGKIIARLLVDACNEVSALSGARLRLDFLWAYPSAGLRAPSFHNCLDFIEEQAVVLLLLMASVVEGTIVAPAHAVRAMLATYGDAPRISPGDGMASSQPLAMMFFLLQEINLQNANQRDPVLFASVGERIATVHLILALNACAKYVPLGPLHLQNVFGNVAMYRRSKEEGLSVPERVQKAAANFVDGGPLRAFTADVQRFLRERGDELMEVRRDAPSGVITYRPVVTECAFSDVRIALGTTSGETAIPRISKPRDLKTLDDSATYDEVVGRAGATVFEFYRHRRTHVAAVRIQRWFRAILRAKFGQMAVGGAGDAAPVLQAEGSGLARQLKANVAALQERRRCAETLPMGAGATARCFVCNVMADGTHLTAATHAENLKAFDSFVEVYVSTVCPFLEHVDSLYQRVRAIGILEDAEEEQLLLRLSSGIEMVWSGMFAMVKGIESHGSWSSAVKLVEYAKEWDAKLIVKGAEWLKNVEASLEERTRAAAEGKEAKVDADEDEELGWTKQEVRRKVVRHGRKKGGRY